MIPLPSRLKAKADEEKGKRKGIKQLLAEGTSKDKGLSSIVTTSSSFGIVYYAALVYAVYYVTWYQVFPKYYSETTEFYFEFSQLEAARALLAALLFEIHVNYILVWWYAGFYRPKSSLPTSSSSGRYCDTCKHDIPSRAAHCFMCSRCVLRREHHCFFTGRCVGHHNQSFFVIMNFYLMIAAFYTGIHIYWFVSEEMYPFWSAGWYDYMLPVSTTRWLFGYVSMYHLGLISLVYVTFISSVCCAGFALYQMYLISNGQTSYELKKEITAYSLSQKENISSVFGKYPFIQLIFPVPFIRNLPDGTSYQGMKIV